MIDQTWKGYWRWFSAVEAKGERKVEKFKPKWEIYTQLDPERSRGSEAKPASGAACDKRSVDVDFSSDITFFSLASWTRAFFCCGPNSNPMDWGEQYEANLFRGDSLREMAVTTLLTTYLKALHLPSLQWLKPDNSFTSDI